jgi:hypothetical protein
MWIINDKMISTGTGYRPSRYSLAKSIVIILILTLGILIANKLQRPPLLIPFALQQASASNRVTQSQIQAMRATQEAEAWISSPAPSRP